ncbi:MAG: DnaJ domain-containing protein [Armatimonadetes bacterium]|nr:DnaJ domain-containing protein [Armatimonadota bacterium]
MATHYETLGVRPKAALEEVRDAYRRLARTYHPDVNPDPKAHEQMAQINVAFEVLSDPVRRMEYDATLGFRSAERESRQTEARRPAAVQAQIYRRLRDHGTPIYGLGFEPGSGRLVSSSFDNEVFWWDDRFEHPRARHKFEGGVVNTISVPRRDAVVAAGSSEQLLHCWSYGMDRPTSWRQAPKSWVCNVAPSPDGKFLAYGSLDHGLRIATVPHGREVYSNFSHKEAVTSVSWARDSRTLATGSADATVKVFDAIAGRELHTFQQVRSLVTALAFSPNGNWLAVAAVDLSIRVFRMRDFTLQKTFYGHDRPIESIAFHPRNWLLATASRDGSLGLWNIRHGIGHGQIEASHQPLSSVAFAPDGRHLVAGGLDKILRVWRLSATAGAAPESE